MKVVWTSLAIADLDAAHAYVSEHNASAAERIIDRIEDAVRAVARHPELGRPGRLEGTRELVVPGTPFVIPYRVKSSRLEILAVIHGARRWPEQL